MKNRLFSLNAIKILVLCVAVALVLSSLYLIKTVYKKSNEDFNALSSGLRSAERRLLNQEVAIDMLITSLRHGLYFDKPYNNYVFQRSEEKADIPYSISNLRKFNRIEVSLIDKASGNVVYKKVIEPADIKFTGVINNVPSGFYDLSVSVAEDAGSIEATHTINISVGDVFLIAGQSNAASPAQGISSYYSKTGMVSTQELTFDRGYYNNETPLFLIPNENRPVTKSICWIYLGDLLVEKFKVPVQFINVSQGNSSSTQWNPETGYLFNRISDVIRSRKIRAVLWHQGESDVLNNIPPRAIINNMTRMILKSREAVPGLSWFVAINSLNSNSRHSSNIKNVRMAQKYIIDSGLAFAGPDADVIRANPDWVERGGGEFVGDGLREHGELWFKTLSRYFETVKANDK